MPELDTIIKKSLADATPHTKKVYSQNPMTGEELVEFANSRAGLALAATVRPDQKPHLSPIDVNIVDGRIYVGIDEGTARLRNLKFNPSINIMVAEGWKRQAIIEGETSLLDVKDPKAAGVLEAQKKKYGWTTQLLAEVLPRKIFTYKSPPKAAEKSFKMNPFSLSVT